MAKGLTFSPSWGIKWFCWMIIFVMFIFMKLNSVYKWGSTPLPNFYVCVFSWLEQIRVVYRVSSPNNLGPTVDKLYEQCKKTFEDYISSEVNSDFLQKASLYVHRKCVCILNFCVCERTCRYCRLLGERRAMISWRNCWEDWSQESTKWKHSYKIYTLLI